jgi:hypothetical protein
MCRWIFLAGATQKRILRSEGSSPVKHHQRWNSHHWEHSLDRKRRTGMTWTKLLAKRRMLLRLVLTIVTFVASISFYFNEHLKELNDYNEQRVLANLVPIDPFFLPNDLLKHLEDCKYVIGNSILSGHTVCETKEERAGQERRLRFEKIEADRLDQQCRNSINPLGCGLQSSRYYTHPSCYGQDQKIGYLPTQGLCLSAAFEEMAGGLIFMPPVAFYYTAADVAGQSNIAKLVILLPFALALLISFITLGAAVLHPLVFLVVVLFFGGLLSAAMKIMLMIPFLILKGVLASLIFFGGLIGGGMWIFHMYSTYKEAREIRVTFRETVEVLAAASVMSVAHSDSPDDSSSSKTNNNEGGASPESSRQ